jgi:hypothetical protein
LARVLLARVVGAIVVRRQPAGDCADGPGDGVDHADDVVEPVSHVHVPHFVEGERNRAVEPRGRIAAKGGHSGIFSVASIAGATVPGDRHDMSFAQVDRPHCEVLAVRDVEPIVRAKAKVVDPVEVDLVEACGLRLEPWPTVPENAFDPAIRVETPHTAARDLVHPHEAFSIDDAVAHVRHPLRNDNDEGDLPNG